MLIYRQNKLLDKSRYETDAEHSWHIAVMAMLLIEYAEDPATLDINKVIKMLLVHDIVEIYAGDTFFYDEEANKTKAAREQAAADKIFSILPMEQGVEIRDLWEEFEALQTAEAYYARAMDILQPFFLHYCTQGQVWLEESINVEQVYRRAEPLKKGLPKLWEFVELLIEQSVKKGYLNA